MPALLASLTSPRGQLLSVTSLGFQICCVAYVSYFQSRCLVCSLLLRHSFGMSNKIELRIRVKCPCTPVVLRNSYRPLAFSSPKLQGFGSYCLLQRRSLLCHGLVSIKVRNTFHSIPNTPHDFQNGGLSCDSEIILF